MTQYMVFLILSPVAALATVSALLLPRWSRQFRIIPSLRLFLLCELAFVIFNTVELLTPSEAGTLFFAKLNYLFISFGPVFWFYFAREYSGRPASRFMNYLPFIIVPLATVCAAFTNDWHRMLWQEYRFAPVKSMLVMQVVRYGPMLPILFIHNYLLFFSGATIIIRRTLLNDSRHRMQVVWMFLGVFLPLVFNLIYLARLIPGFTKDYSAIAFSLGGVFFTIGAWRVRLFEDYPLNRGLLVESIPFGIMLVDTDGHICDANGACAEILSMDRGELANRPIDQFFPGWFATICGDPPVTEGQTQISAGHAKNLGLQNEKTLFIHYQALRVIVWVNSWDLRVG